MPVRAALPDSVRPAHAAAGGKYVRRLPDFDDKVISMYARDMTTREIAAHDSERGDEELVAVV